MSKETNKKLLFDISKLDKDFLLYEKIMTLHRLAIEKDEDTYIDPATGFKVFTAVYLLEKSNCCGSGCRHCPYEK